MAQAINCKKKFIQNKGSLTFLFQGLQAMFIQVQVQELIKQNTYSFTKRENNKIIVKFWRKKAPANKLVAVICTKLGLMFLSPAPGTVHDMQLASESNDPFVYSLLNKKKIDN